MHISAIPTKHAQAFRQGAPDAHGQKPERAISNGRGNPCRHCLKNIPKGAPMLVLAYRPFDNVNPYTETGPIFCVRTIATAMRATAICHPSSPVHPTI